MESIFITTPHARVRDGPREIFNKVCMLSRWSLEARGSRNAMKGQSGKNHHPIASQNVIKVLAFARGLARSGMVGQA